MGKAITFPEDLQFQSVKILSNSGQSSEGRIAFKEWSDRERKRRGFRKTAKIVGTIFGCSLIGLFVHILLIVIIPTLVLTTLVSFPLYMKYSSEKATFFKVEGACPYCGKKGDLRPYLNSQLSDSVTAQCPDCGQTAKVELG